MTTNGNKKAVAYCRVSSIKQTVVGAGLSSQETRCREYAAYRNFDVVQVFTDDVSGGLIDRPGMQAMLSYLRKHRREGIVVIIDDISRLARSLDAHLQLRAAISGAGAFLESPSIAFGEDPDSVLVENMLASVSQHQRQKNGEQTKNRMRARVMNGYWVFCKPLGYRYKQVPGQGKILIRDEPIASIIQAALEGFASGRFQTQSEIKRFLESNPDYPRDRKGEVHLQRVYELLTRIVYTGYVEAPAWGVSLRAGHHEGLISYETFERNQDRLRQKAKAPTRKNISQQFPLRGFVLCSGCGRPLTAAFSTSRSGEKYPYYVCQNKKHEGCGKSIPRADLEGEFEDLLCTIRPAENVFRAAEVMFRDLWQHQFAQLGEVVLTIKHSITKVERSIEQFLDRIVDAQSAAVIITYEQRIAKLEREKILLTGKLAESTKPQRTFEEQFEHAMRFLENPMNLWTSERFEDRRAVLKLAFAGHLTYDRNQGYRTANLSAPFKVLADFSVGNFGMVGRVGIEPTTY